MADSNSTSATTWKSEWDEGNQRMLYTELETGHSQWEAPHAGMANESRSTIKRRLYAPEQTQAYNQQPPPASTEYHSRPEKHLQMPFFTPGLSNAMNSEEASFPNNSNSVASTHIHQAPAQGSSTESRQATIFHHTSETGPEHGRAVCNLLNTPPDPSDLASSYPQIRLPLSFCLSKSPMANAEPLYQRSTLTVVPASPALHAKSKIPFGVIISPNRSLPEGEIAVPVVSDAVIARCRRCRAYIHPFVQFIDGGNRWRCTLCMMSNEVPQLFDWDQESNQPKDRWMRPELNNGIVEYIAPTEYMVRAPQPPVYCVLIDVSHNSISTGMVATACRALKESLVHLPNSDNRGKIAILCFDSAIYCFSTKMGNNDWNMFVVTDLDDIFLPTPNDLLINLSDALSCIEFLLEGLDKMFHDSFHVGSALGSALQAGFKLISPIGGRMIVLSTCLPNLGAGALKNREDPKLLGTHKESSLLQPASTFYKTFAIDCSRAQISVDMFLFSGSYQDVASLACLPHYTSGQTYFYPAFNASKAEDVIKFAHEFSSVLCMPVMLEAITRVRLSKNLRVSSFYGNFFVRSTDLLAMPAVPQDQSYAIEVQIEDNLSHPFVIIQTAVLHSTCYGERRIRVITLALPTTNNLTEVYACADQLAIVALLANKAVERSISHRLEDARDAVVGKLSDLLSGYKATIAAGGSVANGQLLISDNLRMLPALLLGLIKNVGLRQSSQIPPDLRAYAHVLLTTLPTPNLIAYLYPTLYSLHDMPADCGTVTSNGLKLPVQLPSTAEKLERHGLYLIEDSQSIFLWVGKDAVPQLIQDVFGLPSSEQLVGGKTALPMLDNPFSKRIFAIVAKIREMRRGPYHPHLYVVKEGGEAPLRLWALSALVQDRNDGLPSYQQFIATLREKVNGT